MGHQLNSVVTVVLVETVSLTGVLNILRLATIKFDFPYEVLSRISIHYLAVGYTLLV